MKTLKIGLTGDYPPFSKFNSASNDYTGFDVEMASLLAKDLHVKIEFVHTTWGNLGKDLQANLFDVGMGGISITPEREKQFLFSSPIANDEKVAVIRSDEKNQLTSLTAIDQPNIIVVENPGGTNETTARAILKKAKIIIYPDNKTIFQYLLNHQANAMITDKIEAYYQKSLHPELLIVMLPNMPEEPKAYLLRKDEKSLQTKINAFLAKIQANGELAKLKKLHHVV